MFKIYFIEDVLFFLDLEKIFVTFGLLDKNAAQEFLKVSVVLLTSINCMFFYQFL